MNRTNLLKAIAFLLLAVGFVVPSMMDLSRPGSAGPGKNDLWASGRPKVDEPQINPAVMYDFLASSEVRQMAESVWRQSRNGMLKTEQLFIVTVRPDGTFETRQMEATFESHRFTHKWVPGTVAVFHTHPNDARPEPSPLDIEAADYSRAPILTITRDGLFVYSPQAHSIMRLYQGTGWTSDGANADTNAGTKAGAKTGAKAGSNS
jgi:hypothetical protein